MKQQNPPHTSTSPVKEPTVSLVLCSQSPRRRELLQALGFPFTVRTLAGIDESYAPGLSHQDTALMIASKKAAAYAATRQSGEILITADTIVCIDGKVLGKPADEAEACAMLHLLQGRVHEVVTAVCLIADSGTEQFAVTTEVEFAPLSDGPIRHYVRTFRPLDKAGAYGIQEWIGHVGIRRINGNYDNVVGLPVQELSERLCKYIK